jgi:CDGSH iron-sulfur domain-containing protein 3
MSQAKVVDTKPTVLTLESGTYHWCSCGLSDNQPFCNGSHKGTDFKPVTFQVDEQKQVAICLCKATGNAPFCDGTHKNL